MMKKNEGIKKKKKRKNKRVTKIIVIIMHSGGNNERRDVHHRRGGEEGPSPGALELEQTILFYVLFLFIDASRTTISMIFRSEYCYVFILIVIYVRCVVD